jgi:hypothetical protein
MATWLGNISETADNGIANDAKTVGSFYVEWKVVHEDCASCSLANLELLPLRNVLVASGGDDE